MKTILFKLKQDGDIEITEKIYPWDKLRKKRLERDEARETRPKSLWIKSFLVQIQRFKPMHVLMFESSFIYHKFITYG